jgi:hypothetical protein
MTDPIDPINHGYLTPHPLYTGAYEEEPPILVTDDSGQDPIKHPIRFSMKKPDGVDGKERDQTFDAAVHMRYAATLGLPTLSQRPLPRLGRAIIVGGAPSVKDHLEEIRALAVDKNNYIFAINWTHTWLINQGLIPNGAVFFEIDAEPDTILKTAHTDVTYYICSHCHPKTFDTLADKKRILWHSPPNSEPERLVREELFPTTDTAGGGISTFTRAMTVALLLGFRHLDLFGCDSSFPDDGKTHVDGYETVMDNKTDGMFVYAKAKATGETVRFRTVGYLALQVEEFKLYCQINHQIFSLRVHGDSLLRFVHQNSFPDQYENI